ncbi:MAG: DUF1993 family protein [Candidatus Magasanikbacteria bacterium]
MQEYTKRIIKKLSVIGLIGLVTVLAILGFEFIKRSTGNNVSQDFTKVYKKSSKQNKKLVKLTKEVNDNIRKINTLDLRGRDKDSLDLLKETRRKNKKIKKVADNLSSSLDKLKRLLKKAPDSPKKKTVSEALQLEIKLTKEMKDYSQKIKTFLDSLDKAIAQNSSSKKVSLQEKLKQVNKKRKQINDLNSKFLAKIEKLNSTGKN